jgi:aldehyde:ferredoxin oxidoreductase
MAFCEMFLPTLESLSPEVEMKYYAAVTGKRDSFADTMRVGQKIWTLERAIRVMHGRSRQTEDLAPFMYKPGASGMTFWGGCSDLRKRQMAFRHGPRNVPGQEGRG